MRSVTLSAASSPTRAAAAGAVLALLGLTGCAAQGSAASAPAAAVATRLATSHGAHTGRAAESATASAQSSPSGAPSPTAHRPTAAPGRGHAREASPQHPLRLLVTGDSMLEVVGQFIQLQAGSAVEAQVRPRYSTGLVREDFFDWPAHVSGIVRAASPDVVIFMLGGNDAQNIRLADGRLLPMGSAEWAREYERRARTVMRQLVGDGEHRAYWVSMPPAKSPGTREVMRVANRATREAAASVPGVGYVDIWPQFATSDGGFRDVVDGVEARQDDGVHLSRDGARLLAGRLLRLLHASYGVSI